VGDDVAEREAVSWIDRLREFSKDVRAEFFKVSWPTRAVLRDSTIVVIVTVLIVTAFIGAVDRALALGVNLLFR